MSQKGRTAGTCERTFIHLNGPSCFKTSLDNCLKEHTHETKQTQKKHEKRHRSKSM